MGGCNNNACPCHAQAKENVEKISVMFIECNHCEQSAPIVDGKYNIVHDKDCPKDSPQPQSLSEAHGEGWEKEFDARFSVVSPETATFFNCVDSSKIFLDNTAIKSFISATVAQTLMNERERLAEKIQADDVSFMIVGETKWIPKDEVLALLNPSSQSKADK